MVKNNKSIPSRRNFLFKAASACTLSCFAIPNLLGSDNEIIPQDEKHKFQADSDMTMQQVFNFAYRQNYIPAMKNLMKQIGKEKFLEMLKNSSNMIHQVKDDKNIDYSTRTFGAYSDKMKRTSKKMTNKISYEILVDNDKQLEIKFTECLFAKTFRESKAADIGYAGFCHQDYGMAKKFNLKLKLTRDKTLMQGDDCCHFKWTMET